MRPGAIFDMTIDISQTRDMSWSGLVNLKANSEFDGLS